MKSITGILVAVGIAGLLSSQPALAGEGKKTLQENVAVEEAPQVVGRLCEHRLGQPLHVPRSKRY